MKLETRNLNNEKVTIEELYYKKGQQDMKERILKIIEESLIRQANNLILINKGIHYEFWRDLYFEIKQKINEVKNDN